MILLFMFFMLFSSILFLFFMDSKQKFYIQTIGLLSSSIVLLLSLYLICIFDFNSSYYQNTFTLSSGVSLLNIDFSFGVDGISVFFVFLTAFLIFLCILFSWESPFLKEHFINLLVLDFLLILVFSVLDLLLFYIFFEAILIPMFLLIGFLGSRARKIRAAYLLFFYTLFGSVLMLIGLIYIYSVVGTLNLEYVISYKFSSQEQYWLWLAFFMSFASKIPMFPFHIWLPEAHVEAPTIGSVLLAGILLKLGVYGFLRFSLTLFPEASFYFSPLIYLLSIIGILYTSFTAIRQTDIKRIIAYSSIAHMNLVTLGIFSFNTLGLDGAILQSLSHGFVSGGMFLMIGILYDRYHTRLLFYYSGLVHMMPVYASFLLVLTMANIALPGTSSFVGEFLLFCGLYKVSSVACIVGALSVVIGGAYSLWLYNRIMFGNLKISYTKNFVDLTLKEFVILLIIIIPVLYIGISPSLFLQGIKMSTLSLSFLNI